MTYKKDRKTVRQKEGKRERQKDRKTEREKDRKTERQKDRKTERQKDRKIDKKRQIVKVCVCVKTRRKYLIRFDQYYACVCVYVCV